MTSETHEKTRLCLKSVGEIVNSACPNFFVDQYQRGYKWDSEQVRELLDDINNFKIKDLDFYCLQPIIVKYRDDEKAWELIDGQQRITTIYLVLTYLRNNQHLQIKYKTRESSEEFLKLIGQAELSKETTWSEFIDQCKYPDNVDNYHFFNAYQTIMTWFEKDDCKDFLDKLCKYTKVIWYDVTNGDASDQVNSIKIFSRVNAGKIKLTDAELIKALLLNGSTVDSKNYAMMVDRAKEWDDIEKTLQDDEFWYFINGSANTDKRHNRIEFLLGLVADDIFNDKGAEIKKKGVFGKDALHYIFYCFYFSNNYTDNWIKVKNYFEVFYEWFKDNKNYHYVGYLIYCGGKIKKIFNFFEKLPKSEFTSKLKCEIKEHLMQNGKSLNDLSYAEDTDRKYIINILLLFNIETVLLGKDGARFLFDRFMKNKWSLEHIHAQKSKRPDDSNNNNYPMPEDFQKWIENNVVITENADLFSLFGDMDEESMHSIENLALLDTKTNTSLGKNLFPVKRNRIVEADKQGIFIPIATRNVFLKYYTKNPKSMYYWNEEDRKSYLKEIKDVLHNGGYINQEGKV